MRRCSDCLADPTSLSTVALIAHGAHKSAGCPAAHVVDSRRSFEASRLCLHHPRAQHSPSADSANTMHSRFLFLKEQIKGIIITIPGCRHMFAVLMMMMPFNCSYRNKNEPTAIYPSLGYSSPHLHPHCVLCVLGTERGSSC